MKVLPEAAISKRPGSPASNRNIVDRPVEIQFIGAVLSADPQALLSDKPRIMEKGWEILLTTAVLIAYVISAAWCPASVLSLTLFGAVATLYLCVVLLTTSSIFNSVFGLFLLVGFYVKFIAHFGGSSKLIEPTGLFDGSREQWSEALYYSSVGLFGSAAATLVCSKFPSVKRIRDARFSVLAMPTLRVLFWLGAAVALLIYGLNVKWNILRIGYPISVELRYPLYPFLAFMIAWGLLFALVAIACWMIALRPERLPIIVYVTAVVGFFASITMGSRVQLLLYVLVGTVIMISWSGIRGLVSRPAISGFLFAAFLLGLSVVSVSLQRNLAFSTPDLRPAVVAQNAALDVKGNVALIESAQVDSGTLSSGVKADTSPSSTSGSVDHSELSHFPETAPVQNRAQTNSSPNTADDQVNSNSPPKPSPDPVQAPLEQAEVPAPPAAQVPSPPMIAPNTKAPGGDSLGPKLDESVSHKPDEPVAAQQKNEPALSPNQSEVADKNPAPQEQASTIPVQSRVQWMIIELKSLAIMRWVGLEGVMTAIGTREPKGLDLVARMVREDPALGHDGTYQHLAGDIYAGVAHFTFLTLPGPIGIAAFSGSYVAVATLSFLLLMVGHTIEWVAARLTRNIGCVAVTGVSLAYLFVQICFPKTLFFYVFELIFAISAMGAFGWLLARLFPVRARSTAPS